MEKIKLLSLFSGIGAFEKALENLGVCDAMYGYEIDEDYTVLNFEDYIISSR